MKEERKMSQLERVFIKAQTNLCDDDFRLWLCFAYGVLNRSIGIRLSKSEIVEIVDILADEIRKLSQ